MACFYINPNHRVICEFGKIDVFSNTITRGLEVGPMSRLQQVPRATVVVFNKREEATDKCQLVQIMNVPTLRQRRTFFSTS